MKEINLVQLQAAINQILDYLTKQKGVQAVALEKDMYWNVPTDALYFVDKQPSELDIGSLYDDWEFVQANTIGASEAVPLQLTEIATLLRYIGEVSKP